MSKAPVQLTSAIAALWRGPRFELPGSLQSPLFRNLVEACVELFPEAAGTTGKSESPDFQGVSWALLNALHATGMPLTRSDISPFATSPEKVAAVIVEAMRAKEVQLIHLCPLDQADDWPAMRFGPCEIRRFAKEELSAAFQVARLQRHHPSWRFDEESFTQFTWLTVRETRSVRHPVGGRAFPALYEPLDRPFGAIDPHVLGFPEIVERALFALLLLPWERMTEAADFEWRGFRVPWSYTANADPFARPALPPSADSLSWEPDIFDDPLTGETIESERPVVLWLASNAVDYFASMRDERWKDIETGLASSIFNPLAAHFFVRAFLSEGIDEFLGHVIAIEAALGISRDHDVRSRPKVGRYNVGATDRIARRIATVTGTDTKAEDFRRLSSFGAILSMEPSWA